MKRILLSLVMLGVTSLLAIGATTAFFSDTEVVAGNTITAGTLNLTVNGKEGAEIVHLTVSNAVPAIQWLGAEYDYQWTLKNDGTVPGTVTYKIINIKNIENGCNAPELAAGDITCGTGEDQGELGQQFKALFQLNQSPYGYNQELYPINNFEGTAFTPAAYHLNAGETKNVYLRSWFISAANNNLAQGDTLEFDIEFTLLQD